MRARHGVLLLLFAGATACSDDMPTAESYTEPPRHEMILYVPGFTFLAPLAPNAQPSGSFNPDLKPVLEVCRVENDQCAAQFGRLLTTGDLKTGIVSYPDSSFYKAIVAPGTLGVPGFTTGRYRLTVRSGPAPGAALLGTIEVLYDVATGRISLPTGEVLGEFGTPLTARFFIADGTLCTTRASDNPDGSECLEVAVGPDGGTFATEDSTAGAYFPPNALTSTVTLVIERYEAPTGPGEPASEYLCIPTNFPQYGGCYRFRTEPAVAEFNLEVVVGVCPDPEALPLEEQLELWKWDEQDPATVTMLPRRNVEFLACPGYDGNPLPNELGGLSWANRLLRPLAKLFGPAPVYAGKVSPFGAGLNDFSRMGWVRPLSLQIAGGNQQQGYIAQPLPNPAVVRVVASGEKVAGQNLGVGGIPVQFTPALGSGLANPVNAVTDANGYAGTTWTLGNTGTNTMTVNGSNPFSTFPNRAGIWSSPPRSGPVVFTANARLPYRTHFLSPLSSGKVGAGDVNVPNLPVTVRACSVQTGECWSAAPVANTSMYHFQWTAGASFPSGTYNFDVLLGNVVYGHFAGAVGKKGSKPPAGTDFTFELGSTVQIKFLMLPN